MMLIDKWSNADVVTVRDKKTTIYLLYCVVVVLLIIAIAYIYRPNNKKVSTHTSGHTPTTKQHPAGTSAGKGGSTPIAVNGNGKGDQHISGVSSAPSTASTTTTSQPALSNSGPGNVIGFFVLASVVGTLAWRRKLIRSVI